MEAAVRYAVALQNEAALMVTDGEWWRNHTSGGIAE
jgi:hypothetical protein